MNTKSTQKYYDVVRYTNTHAFRTE